MTQEKKQELTLRISQANKTELITILYEMTHEYTKDAMTALENKDMVSFKESLRVTRGCVKELMLSLHYEHELAMRFLEIYMFLNRELALAEARKKPEYLEHVLRIVQKLWDSYKELEKKDTSGPVMEHTQQVYTGLTYGRDSLSVSSVPGQEANRGFTV